MLRVAEERLFEIMGKKGIDGFFISNITNVRYISGYTGDEAWLFITKNNRYFITDPRYTEQASYECPEYIILDHRSKFRWSPAAGAAKLAEKEGLKNLAFEENVVTAADYLKLAAGSVELMPVSGIVEEIRMHKSKQEIEYLTAACEIASRSYDRIQKDIRVGITEKELAANLHRYMVLEGADTMPYGNILISGARTSLLHGIPSNKAIEYGDLVLMDYGCQFHGYMSDMTRTVVVGKATEKQREVYNLVRQMNEAMEASVKDGVSAQVPYYTAYDIVKETEYEPYFYTGIGHGVGLYVHEVPFIDPKTTDVIYKGVVHTIEPGIYIPGWGGIRIEDQGLVTDEGYQNLIGATKDLIEL